MNDLLADLLKVLKLERLELDLFRGESRDPGHRRVFGGQVLGQALTAAYATVENRPVHSLHAYFLRGGDPDLPIIYEVDRSRDGRSFSSRRVVAIQRGAQIFHMSASFQFPEEGVDRQSAMPAAPAPEDTPDMATAITEIMRKDPNRPRPWDGGRNAFEFRPAVMPDPGEPTAGDPQMMIWFRTVDRLPDDPVLHHCLLAYASDYYLLGVAGLDVRWSVNPEDLQVASIDHAMWFHRPARADEWLLYVLDSPNAISSRGLGRGRIYTRDGVLVASTAQEGLMRHRRKD